MAVVMSMPMARPSGPTIFAARNTSSPPPEPRSTTTSPGLRCDLKNLSSDAKDRLFLAKLAWISRTDSNALNKRNLTLPNEPYGLAPGYAPQERSQVIEHLLGGPWNRLVNAGYLVDINRQGFHKVSRDGQDFLSQQPTAEGPITVRHRIADLPPREPGAPRVFISYSWDSELHKAWVLELAKLLKSHGIDIILDRWHLRPGFDRTYFMEQAVAQSDYVVIICTENYAVKANSRTGGVGYESLIITAEVARQALTDKFIPVLRQGTFDKSLPLYLGSRIGVDLQGDPYNDDNYEELLRQLHGEPIVAPPIGKKPDFSSGDWKIKPGTPSPAAAVATLPPAPNKPVEQKPNASAWARYDKPREKDAWVSWVIRKWEDSRYSFEVNKGNAIVSEEFFTDTQGAVNRFIEFNRDIITDGYKRMQFSPGLDLGLQIYS
jgi:hypothetical protein